MLKIKFAKLHPKNLVLLLLFAITILGVNIPSASAATATSGPCAVDASGNYSYIDNYIARLPAITAGEIAANAKTKDIMTRSCVCNGTLTLNTEGSVKSCEDCKNGSKSCLQNNVIIQDIQKIVNFLSALVGIVVIGSIMLGGIQYALGGDNAEKVGQAKKRIGNSLFAFLIFILTFAFLQWLIPGGIFK